MTKHFGTIKQPDIDKGIGQVLELDQPVKPETIQRDITGRIIEDRAVAQQRYLCDECGEADVHYEGILDYKEVFVCYNCGHEPREPERVDPDFI